MSTNGSEATAATVRDQIRLAIMQGEYAPRQRLIEADLCEQFGASRSAVRTALQDLASQGLVEFQRNRGARIRAVSVAEAIEITEVRMMLEAFIAGRAAHRITRPQAKVLTQLLAELRVAAEEGDLANYQRLTASLNENLREIAHHKVSAQLVQQLRDLTHRHRFALSMVPGRPFMSLPHHEAIVAAVVAGDAPSAEAAMRAHLQSVIGALTTLDEVAGR